LGLECADKTVKPGQSLVNYANITSYSEACNLNERRRAERVFGYGASLDDEGNVG
jgi:hypothetical protein